MTDLNEYVAEAIETAYGIDYDTVKAQAVIDKLTEQRWVIDDADNVAATIQRWADRHERLLVAMNDTVRRAAEFRDAVAAVAWLADWLSGHDALNDDDVDGINAAIKAGGARTLEELLAPAAVLCEQGPRFVKLTRQWVNVDQVVLVVADTESECTLWLAGGHTVVEPSPAAEVAALLQGGES